MGVPVVRLNRALVGLVSLGERDARLPFVSEKAAIQPHALATSCSAFELPDLYGSIRIACAAASGSGIVGVRGGGRLIIWIRVTGLNAVRILNARVTFEATFDDRADADRFCRAYGRGFEF